MPSKFTFADITITPTNSASIDMFVRDNLEVINNNIKLFSKQAKNKELIPFDQTDIRRHLKQQCSIFLSYPANQDDLWRRYEAEKGAKSKIAKIANDIGLYKSDLEEFFEQSVFEKIKGVDHTQIVKDVVDIVFDKASLNEFEKTAVKKSLLSILERSLYLALTNGFTFNTQENEAGVMSANAGDSAQFLFLARAILAGYNCSNVDVRSSRYDAVIDKGGKLFRVQVKGIAGDSASFKDRTRGGAGIDTSNSHNIGQRITSADCDIYVAVDKQLGICYIIPVSQIDHWGVDSKPLSALVDYKENWQVIDSLAAP